MLSLLSEPVFVLAMRNVMTFILFVGVFYQVFDVLFVGCDFGGDTVEDEVVGRVCLFDVGFCDLVQGNQVGWDSDCAVILGNVVVVFADVSAKGEYVFSVLVDREILDDVDFLPGCEVIACCAICVIHVPFDDELLVVFRFVAENSIRWARAFAIGGIAVVELEGNSW